MKMAVPLVPLTDAKTTAVWACRHRREFMWSKNTVGMTGQFLEYQHPEMRIVRDKVNSSLQLGKIHPRMLLNYDQVWKIVHRLVIHFIPSIPYIYTLKQPPPKNIYNTI